MNVSLIITTYNWKEALELSLLSGLKQKKKPTEIIVADDGSRPDTGEIITKIAEQSPFPVIHSWQKDEGFRLSASRNKAIAKTSGDYIVLIDGDIIMEEHFIADHIHFAHPSCFVQGTRVLLKEELSEKVFSAFLSADLLPVSSRLFSCSACVFFLWSKQGTLVWWVAGAG
ncbi:MAG: glycosyltransferase, partial [Candidatus Electrothrix sp. ATG1]|nr:glycosyltransferase [Candidatus Electrothrix sp. ATG1]